MDALALDYGSDSSEELPNPTSNNAPTIGLLSNYSDDSDAETDIKAPPAAARHEMQSPNSQNDCKTSKKQRLNEKDEQVPGLPQPKLLKLASDADNVGDSQDGQRPPSYEGILFRRNYLENMLRYKEDNRDPHLCDKLNQLQQSSNTSFAQQLKSQKEFGNPHTFPSVIEHFGIDAMESNIIIGGKKTKFEGFEFLERLLAKEEENRVRQGQG